MKRVLITGGAGFIGSRLALVLLDRGYAVTVLDNLSPQIHGEDPEQSFTYQLVKDATRFIRGSVEKDEDWGEALDGADIVVHLAAETGTGQSMYQVGRYVDVNIRGTSLLLDRLVNKQNAVDKLIVASSRSIYGEGKYHCDTDGDVYPAPRADEAMSRGDFAVKCPICGRDTRLVPTDEASLSHPISVYGYTKKVQEELSLLVGQSINLPVIAYRFQNVYGPGQSLKNPYTGILSIFSTQIKNGRDITIFEDGQESRDFVYIDDVVDAIVLGIEHNEGDGEVFNVGSKQSMTVYDIAKILRAKYGSSIDLHITGNYRLGDIRGNIADVTKIERRLGYVPKVLFEEGISRFVEWAESQETEDADSYDKSLQEMSEKGLYK